MQIGIKIASARLMLSSRWLIFKCFVWRRLQNFVRTEPNKCGLSYGSASTNKLNIYIPMI
jgi:hypothetical protein